MHEGSSFIVTDSKSLERKLSRFIPENTRIVTDFDSTVTADNGKTSWSLFAHSWLMPEEYVKRRQALKDRYFPFEIDPDLPDLERREKMREWWLAHLELFREFQLKLSVLKEVVGREMHIRKGMDSLFSGAGRNVLPILILSAGIRQSIEVALRNNGMFSDSVSIAANSLVFDNEGICCWVDGEHIIHAANKDEWDASDTIKETFSNRSNILLFGDSLEDIKMIEPNLRDSTIAVWFCTSNRTHQKSHFLEAFDIVVQSDDEDAGVGEWIMARILANESKI